MINKSTTLKSPLVLFQTPKDVLVNIRNIERYHTPQAYSTERSQISFPVHYNPCDEEHLGRQASEESHLLAAQKQLVSASFCMTDREILDNLSAVATPS